MSELVELETRGALGVIRINRPPVNALGHALRVAISDAHKDYEGDGSIAAILLTGTGRFFSAGADITEFDSGRREPFLTDLIAQLESGEKPIIALVNGIAYGGGFELALGCDYLYALPGAKLAFPEIKLGNIPGAGGTQKLPRLIGGPKALDIILSGRTVGFEEAEKLGMFEHQAEDLEAALKIAQDAIDAGLPRRRFCEMRVRGTPEELDDVAAPYLRRARGAAAPSRALEGVRLSYTEPIEEGLAWERKTFTELNASFEAKAQRHLFFAERKVDKIPDVPAETPKRPTETAGVVGAGTMGTGIAMCFANVGIPVHIVEQEQAQLDKGFTAIKNVYDSALDKGRISAAEAAARFDRISGSLSMDDLGKADIVVEAAFEAMDVKCEVFSRLDSICKPGAILATNTSTLDVNLIAEATGRPQDVIGLHFFSPAHLMKLLEVVRAQKTSKDVVATSMDLGKKLNKIPVLVGVCDGFAGNRMFINFNREAQILIENGALPWQIDRVLTEWGLAMGPLSVMDLAGLDVGYRIRQARAATRKAGDPYPFTTADRLAEMGRYGQKTGRGWYLYPDNARKGVPDPDVEALIEQVSQEKGITRCEVSDEEILHRCLWQLFNTGCQILEEGIAQRASDLDVIFINGYGFPRTCGGPMFYAEEMGLERVLEDINRNHREFGDHWRPSEFLVNAVRSGRRLDE